MTPVAWSSSRHSPASARPTGMRGLAARSSASPEALAGPNSFGPRSRQWPTNPRCRRRHGEGQRYWRARSPRRRWSVGHGFLLQFQADQLGVPVIRSKVAETTALGSAYLAGLAEGVGLPADVTENWAADGEFTPTTDRARPDADYARWRRAVERSRDWGSGLGVEGPAARLRTA